MADEQLPEGTDTIINGAAASPGGKDGAARVATPDSDAAPKTGGANGTWFDRIEELKTQGFDSARAYAVSGKDQATSALDDLIRTVADAAGQIDSKVGSQYGDYVRRAADGLGSFNEGLKSRDVDDLFVEARALIARAPAVAVGTAAALGFVIARLARSGLPEAAPRSTKTKD